MVSLSLIDAKRYSLAFQRFNRTTPYRYFGIDIAIFGFPLVVAAPQRALSLTSIVAFVSMLAARCGGLTIDDYFDRNSDAIENPDRPVPAGLVTPMQALTFGIISMSVGLVCAAFVNRSFLIAEILAYSALFVSFGLLNDIDISGVPTFGTVTAVSMLSLMGWFTYGTFTMPMVVIFFATWLWDLSHDTIGAYLDRDGDSAADIRTIGVAFSRETVCGIMFLGIIGSFILLAWITAVDVLLIGPLLFLLIVLVRIVQFYRHSLSPKTVRRAIEWYIVGAYAWTGLGLLFVRGLA